MQDFKNIDNKKIKNPEHNNVYHDNTTPYRSYGRCTKSSPKLYPYASPSSAPSAAAAGLRREKAMKTATQAAAPSRVALKSRKRDPWGVLAKSFDICAFF